MDSLADRIEKIDTNGTKQLQQTIVTVDGLRQDIQAVETNASTQLSTLKNTVNGLEQSIERAEADGKSTMASYKQTLDTLQAEFKESQQTVNGATQTKINSLESTIDGLNRTIQNTIQDVDSVQSVANEAKETAQGLQRQITQIEQSTGKGYLSYTVDVNGAKWNPSDNAKAMGAGQGISAAIYDEVKANGAKFIRIDSDRIYPIASYSDINKTIGVDTSQYSRDFEITSGKHTYEFAPSRNGFPSGSIAQYLIEQTAEGLRSQIKTIEATATNASTQINEVIRTAEATQSKVTDVEKQVSSNYTQLSNLINQKVSSQDVQSMIQQSEDRIKLQVSQGTPDGEAIVSAINLTPDLVRIKGNSIRLDGDTIIQDSVIKSSHIESLTADKITAGTLDAAKVRVINLDAQNISGLTSSFIQSRWNAISSSVEINPDGILSTASNGSQVYIQNGIMGARNPSGASIGQIGYQYDGGSPAYVIKTTMGSHFEIWQTANNGTTYKIIQLENGGQSYYNYASAYYFPIGEATFDHKVTISNGADLRMNEGEIVNPYGISLYHGGRLYTLSGGEATRLNGTRELQLQVNGTQKMTIDTTRIYMKQDINMQGHAIAGQSDARLKSNIQSSNYDALSRISKIDFKTFEWKTDGKKDYGFIAQEVQKFAPEWIIDSEPDGYLAYDSTLLTKYALRGIQQLLKRIEDLEEELNEIETRTSIYDRPGTRGTDGSISE